MALLSSALSLNLPALVVSRAVQAVGAAWLTRLAGRSFIVYFQQDQDWGDGGLPEVLQREYELNRREGLLKAFLEVAYRRVVQPLQKQGLRLPPRPPDRPVPGGQPLEELVTRRPPVEAEASDLDDPAR